MRKKYLMMTTFLELNEVILTITNKKVVNLGVDIANRKINVEKLAEMLGKTSQHLPRYFS